MAIDLTLAISQLTVGTRTNSTVAKPTGTSDGDFLLSVWQSHQTDFAVTIPSGWTTLFEEVDLLSRVARTNVAYKRASSEPADWTWTHSSGSSCAAVWRLTGVVSTGAPEDATHNSVDNILGNPYTITQISTATANSAVIYILSRRSSTSTGSSTTLTERLDMSGILIAADVQASAGNTGSKTCTESDANDCRIFLMALKEEGAAAGQPTIKRFGGVPFSHRMTGGGQTGYNWRNRLLAPGYLKKAA